MDLPIPYRFRQDQNAIIEPRWQKVQKQLGLLRKKLQKTRLDRLHKRSLDSLPQIDSSQLNGLLSVVINSDFIGKKAYKLSMIGVLFILTKAINITGNRIIHDPVCKLDRKGSCGGWSIIALNRHCLPIRAQRRRSYLLSILRFGLICC